MALQLTRRIGESFYILGPSEGPICITVSKCKATLRNPQVAIGIKAPKNYSILREELILKDLQQKKLDIGQGGQEGDFLGFLKNYDPSHLKV